MAKPAYEKNSTSGGDSTTTTSENVTWFSIRGVNSATDAQKLKHLRIAYSVQHSAETVRGLIEVMRYPEAVTPSSSEPGRQDNQVKLQRPFVATYPAVHYGFLRWPSFVIRPNEELYLGFRVLAMNSGTFRFNFSASWMENLA